MKIIYAVCRLKLSIAELRLHLHLHPYIHTHIHIHIHIQIHHPLKRTQSCQCPLQHALACKSLLCSLKYLCGGRGPERSGKERKRCQDEALAAIVEYFVLAGVLLMVVVGSKSSVALFLAMAGTA